MLRFFERKGFINVKHEDRWLLILPTSKKKMSGAWLENIAMTNATANRHCQWAAPTYKDDNDT